MKLKLNGLLALFLVLITQITFAQSGSISGTVQDQAGMPLPGVNVLLKGTTTGVQTDFDGKFAIQANAGQALVFSFLGMKTMEMAASANMVVKLADDAVQLEGVVVTALGITREKRSLGYGTQKVDGDEVNRVPNTNFINQLSGKVSGLQVKTNNNFGGSTNVVIRGVKSLSFNNQALFVIDGIPIDNSNSNTTNQRTGRYGIDYGNAASDINPADIESVNVLKGAAATALYGSRAANGAIMITTRKGKMNQGFGVTFESSISAGMIDKSTFIKYQKAYGQGYFGDVFRRRDIDGDGNLDDVARTPDDASYGPIFDPNRPVYGWDSFVPESPYYKTARPWVAAKNDPSEFFETGFTSMNTVGFNGGNDKGAFSLSYTNTESNGVLPNSKQNRNSFIGNASYKLTDKFTATFMGNYINTRTIGRNGTGYSGNLVAGFRQWWGTNVDIKEQRDIYFATGKNYTWNPLSNTNIAPAYWNNPYFERYESYENDSRDRFIGNTTLSYKFTNWFEVMTRLTVDTYSEIQEERLANGSYGGNPFGIAQSNESSGYQYFQRNVSEMNYDLMLNFNRDLSSKLNLKGVLGVNIRRNNRSSILASTSGGLYIPKLYALTNSVNPVEPPQQEKVRRGVDGYYAQASLGFDNTFYIEGSAREDYSSTLPATLNDYFYFSGSASFVFSKYLQADWFDLGKIRGGYAEVGNDAPEFSTFDSYFNNPAFGSQPLYSVPTNKGNPALKPERTKSTELGIELQFFKNRVGLDFSVYRASTFDQIITVPVSEATGYTRLLTNIGELENRGIEATLNLIPVRTKNFSWEITTNFTKNENEVKSLAPGISNYQLATFQGGVSLNAQVGQPFGTLQGTDYEYNNGQRIIDPATGKYVITATNDHDLGTFQPDWTGGMNNRFTYKGLSLSFLIDVQHGGKVFSLDRWYGEGTGIYSNTVGTNDLGNSIRNPIVYNIEDDPTSGYAPSSGGVILQGINPNGQPNTTRIDLSTGLDGLAYNGSANSDYVYDAGYIKLREATLGYTFSKKVLHNTFQDLYIGFSGNNLWIIQKNIRYTDPEAGLSSGNLQGYQSGPLPVTRTVALNLRAKF